MTGLRKRRGRRNGGRIGVVGGGTKKEHEHEHEHEQEQEKLALIRMQDAFLLMSSLTLISCCSIGTG